jgi:hypothetical protein
MSYTYAELTGTAPIDDTPWLPTNEELEALRKKPVFIPHPLKADVLCFGIIRGGQTVIYYNENREIRDAPRVS